MRWIVLSFLSPLFLVGAFPPYEYSFLAWVGLVPLFLMLCSQNIIPGLFLSQISGMVFFMSVFIWIFSVPGFTILHHLLLGAYLGSYIGCFGLLFSFICQRTGPTIALFSAPFIWVVLEFARANFFFLALPWAFLAHSQYQQTALIQVASITGAWGVSFLIVLVNATLSAVILWGLHRYFGNKMGVAHQHATGGGVSGIIVFTILVLCLVVLFGYTSISKPAEGKALKLALVQGNISQAEKWKKDNAEKIMQIYTSLSRKAASEKLDLVVWPETATPKAVSDDANVRFEVMRLVQEIEVPLLLGSSHHQKFSQKGEKTTIRRYNSALLISPGFGKQKKIQQYHKNRLMPFGEYLPMKGKLPWSFINVPDFNNFSAGDQYNTLQTADTPFGVTICWENIFPQIVRRLVNNGAQFIVNITNEAWFGDTAAPYQFLSMSTFRAVENRRFVVRCANTGISCFIDPFGRVVSRVKDSVGRDIFVRGVDSSTIVTLEKHTIYSRFGEWWVWLCMLATALFLLVACLRKNTMVYKAGDS